jgi:hypothetical protein
MIRLLALALTCAGLAAALAGPETGGPYVVRFDEPHREGVGPEAEIDPVIRIKIQHLGRMMFGLQVGDKVALTNGNSVRTSFKVDDRILTPASGPAGPLPPGSNGKRRSGGQSSWTSGDLQFTQVLEVVPTRAAAGQKRLHDAVLIHYVIENHSAAPHQVGVRVRIDTTCNGNDGALFAAPSTQPGKVLDGVELRGRTLPAFVQVLENPDLTDPGFVAHFALKVGSRLVGPDRFLCTGHAAMDDGWDVEVQQANGDSDCALYWDPRLVAPGGRLEVGFAYGKGLASGPEGEGRVALQLGGSFEPHKLFTIAAHVDDPLPNQTLALELAGDLELLEGKTIQPVQSAAGEGLVLWKGRVRATGTHAITVRSSTGVIETRRFTVMHAAGEASR